VASHAKAVNIAFMAVMAALRQRCNEILSSFLSSITATRRSKFIQKNKAQTILFAWADARRPGAES
jgi:hypothetical protein